MWRGVMGDHVRGESPEGTVRAAGDARAGSARGARPFPGPGGLRCAVLCPVPLPLCLCSCASAGASPGPPSLQLGAARSLPWSRQPRPSRGFVSSLF